MTQIVKTRFLDVPFDKLVDFKDRPRDVTWLHFKQLWESERRGKEIGIRVLWVRHADSFCKVGRTFRIVNGPGTGEPVCACVALIGD